MNRTFIFFPDDINLDLRAFLHSSDVYDAVRQTQNASSNLKFSLDARWIANQVRFSHIFYSDRIFLLSVGEEQHLG